MKYIFSVAFTLIGLVFTIAGFFFAYEKYTLLNSPSEKTEGTVVGFIDGSKGTLAPVFEYQTKKGMRLRYESHYFTAPSRYQKGDKIALYYQISNAREVHFDSFSENWGLPIILAFLGSLVLTIGVYTLIKTIQYVNSQKMTTETEPQVNF